MVHEPVSPVKISIVDDQQGREDQPEIKHAMLFDIPVNGGMGFDMRFIQHHRGHSEDAEREQGIKDLPGIIRTGRPALLDLGEKGFMPPDHIKEQEGRTAEDQVPEDTYDENEQDLSPGIGNG